MQLQVLLLEKLDSQKRNQVTLYFGLLILQLITNLLMGYLTFGNRPKRFTMLRGI